jgi:hypothetical protein
MAFVLPRDRRLRAGIKRIVSQQLGSALKVLDAPSPDETAIHEARSDIACSISSSSRSTGSCATR